MSDDVAAAVLGRAETGVERSEQWGSTDPPAGAAGGAGADGAAGGDGGAASRLLADASVTQEWIVDWATPPSETPTRSPLGAQALLAALVVGLVAFVAIRMTVDGDSWSAAAPAPLDAPASDPETGGSVDEAERAEPMGTETGGIEARAIGGDNGGSEASQSDSRRSGHPGATMVAGAHSPEASGGDGPSNGLVSVDAETPQRPELADSTVEAGDNSGDQKPDPATADAASEGPAITRSAATPTTSGTATTPTPEPTTTTTEPTTSTTAQTTSTAPEPTTTTTETATTSTPEPTTTTTETATTPTPEPTTTTAEPTTSTTSEPTATTAETTTTNQPSSPIEPGPLIVSPADGSVMTWESEVNLFARSVPGAVEYCWEVIGPDGVAPSRCDSSQDLVLLGKRRLPGAGPITVEAEARDEHGNILVADRISITLVARDVALDPDADGTIAFGSPRWLRARRIPNATRYCWTLTQDTRAVEVCRPGSKAPMRSPDSLLAGFEGGEMSLQVRAEAGGVVIGRQTITVLLDVDGASPS